MSNAQEFSERQKVALTADLLRRGATLLNESCPRCGGVQIRFQGRVYCINEDNIPGSGQLSPSHTSPERETRTTPIVQPVVDSQQPRREPTVSNASQSISERDSLRKLLEEKLARVSKQLEDSQDFEQQQKLLELISKYLETLEKLEKRNSSS